MHGRRIGAIATSVACLLVSALGPAVAAHAIAADPSFGTAGLARLDAGTDDPEEFLAAAGPFVAGSSGGRMAVATFVPGRAAYDFGGAGRAWVAQDDPARVTALASWREGTLLAGDTGDDLVVSFVDGSPDPLWADIGTLRMPFGAPVTATWMGFIHPLWFVTGSVATADGDRAFVVQLLESGRPDTSFGSGGVVFLDQLARPSRALQVHKTSDGLWVTTLSGGEVVLAALTAGGAPRMWPPAGATLVRTGLAADQNAPVSVRFEDGLTVAGQSGGEAFLARMNHWGVLDAAFATGGVFRTRAGGAVASMAQAISPGYHDLQFAATGTVTHADGTTDAFVVRLSRQGQPLPSFGTNGTAVVDVGGPAEQALGLYIPTGWSSLAKLDIVVAKPGGGATVRLSQEGVVEPASRADVRFGRPWHDRPVGLLRQADGKLVVAADSGSYLLLQRLMPDGRLDPAFRPGRQLVTEVGTWHPTGAAFDHLGRIVVWGQGVVHRFTATGEYLEPVPAASTGRRYERPDGTTVVAGGQWLSRLKADGDLDPTFEPLGGFSSGSFALYGSIVDIEFLPNAEMMILYWSSHDPQGARVALLRVGADGSVLGHTWGTSSSGAPLDLMRLPDGRFIVAATINRDGSAPGGAEWNVVTTRYSPAGAPDPTYGVQGVGRFASGGFVFAADGFLEPDGGVLVRVGTHPDALAGPALERFVRFHGNGSIDRTFGSNGSWTLPGMGPGGKALREPGGAIVVAGPADGKDVDTVVVRLRHGATDGRRIWSWGHNALGTLGVPGGDRTAPTAVPIPVPFRAVAAGGLHTLAVDEGGAVWAWGWNANGQLGDGTTVNRLSPVRVGGLSGVVAVAAGITHSLALKTDGTVWAWGWNAPGQVGDGTGVDRLRPVRVAGLTGVRAIAAGSYHSLALGSDGSVWGWGWNGLGQLGDGTGTNRLAPVKALVTGVSAIAAGGYHSLAVGAGGSVYGWGWNHYGPVGTAATGPAPVPAVVPGLSGMTSVAAGGLHSLAVARDGSVWSWGWNGLGQLGDGTRTDRRTPVKVPAFTAASVAAGSYHSAAVSSDGAVHAWGWNALGQVGDGTTVDRLTPVPITPATGGTLSVTAGALHTVAL